MRKDVREAAYLLEIIVMRAKGVEGIGISHTKKGKRLTSRKKWIN